MRVVYEPSTDVCILEHGHTLLSYAVLGKGGDRGGGGRGGGGRGGGGRGGGGRGGGGRGG